MQRNKIIHEAKWLVALHGPTVVQEFAGEIVDGAGGWDDDTKEEILKEALRQAERVMQFLGL